jgi:WD40 repeat protein
MAEVTRAVDSPVAEEGKPPEYDAFLSYAHRDRQVTTAIQKGLHQIGRRVGQLRALRVFRDDTNLTANPDLWGKITEALDRSRFMIVVLSPRSAGSHWVNEEVTYWLQNSGHEQLMLVLAEGHLQWDAKNARFDPTVSDAAPLVLTKSGSLPAEPLYIDVSGDAPWDLRSLAFRDKVTALAAPIHGKPKDQLAGDDIREQRRFRRLRRAAIAGLAVLTVVAVVAALIAVAKQQEAIRRLHDATVAKLNAEGAAMLSGDTPGGDMRALQELLAANAIEANGPPVLNAQIARFTTQKIINTGSNPHCLAYSPDGHRIVTGQLDGTLRQWDSATGKPVGAPMKGTGMLTAVAFTHDGQTIASASSDGTMRLWNAATGAAINPNPQHVESLGGLAVSPSGKILTGGQNDTIQVWDPNSGQLLAAQQVFDDHTAFITAVTFDRTGHLFAASGSNGDIAVYDAKPFKPLKLHAPIITIMDPANSNPVEVYRIAFSPDGHTIAAGSGDGALQLWNADTGTLIWTIRVGGLTGVETVAFSPDGHRIATGRTDGPLQLWDPDTGAQIGQTLIGHTGVVYNVAFSPDGRQIATVSQDGTLRLWSASVGQPMTGPYPGDFQVAFSPDGQRVAASGDTAVQQWDVNSGQPLPALTEGGTGTHWFAYVDGGRIVTAAGDGTVQVWNTNTGKPARPPVHINVPVAATYITFAFTGDGRRLAWGRLDDGIVSLWDVATGRSLGQPMTIDPPKFVGGLAFSPDGHRLVAGYADGLRLWNTDTTQLDGTVITNPEPDNPVGAVAFSRDGTTVAAGHVDGAVELWDLSTRKQLPGSPLHGHTAAVESVAFGVAHQLATGGDDATLRLWDTATGQPTAEPQTGPYPVRSVAISPDGRLAARGTLYGLLSPAISDPSQLCDKFATNMSHKQWRDWVSPAIKYITLCPGLPIAPD